MNSIVSAPARFWRCLSAPVRPLRDFVQWRVRATHLGGAERCRTPQYSRTLPSREQGPSRMQVSYWARGYGALRPGVQGRRYLGYHFCGCGHATRRRALLPARRPLGRVSWKRNKDVPENSRHTPDGRNLEEHKRFGSTREKLATSIPECPL